MDSIDESIQITASRMEKIAQFTRAHVFLLTVMARLCHGRVSRKNVTGKKLAEKKDKWRDAMHSTMRLVLRTHHIEFK